MGTKERLAERFEALARMVPGIGSYQDKEGLREGDKRLRDILAGRLDGARRHVETVISARQQDGILKGLDRLGHLERKLQQAADALRYATRGYSGVFDTVKMDEGKLEAMFTFDIAMAESVSGIETAAEGLKNAFKDDTGTMVVPLLGALDAFQDKLHQRDRLFD